MGIYGHKKAPSSPRPNLYETQPLFYPVIIAKKMMAPRKRNPIKRFLKSFAVLFDLFIGLLKISNC